MDLLPKWLIIVALTAWATSIRCLLDSTFIVKRIYNLMSISKISGLDARILAIWILLAGTIRFLCALQPQNTMLYGCTLFTFVLALAHFTSECFIYHTASIYEPGIYMPLIISSASIVWMLCTWQYYTKFYYEATQVTLSAHHSALSKRD